MLEIVTICLTINKIIKSTTGGTENLFKLLADAQV